MPVSITRTHYETACYRGGKRTGIIENFASRAEALEQAERCGLLITEYPWNQIIRDADVKDGIALFTVRTVHKPDDMNMSGERIFA